MKTRISLNQQLFLISLFLIAISFASCGQRPNHYEQASADKMYDMSVAEEGEVPPPPDGDEPKDSFNTESYDKIVENPFVSSIKNPLSTFSVDVDRASYANIRRYLNENTLPPPDAVRIEEMINYFDYSYPLPTGNVPFSINLELAACPWNTEHQIITIGLKGKEIDVKNLPSSNLVFLVDVSGSMDVPNKLPLLKQSFKILIEKLRSSDKVAIVVYAGAAGCALPSTSCSNKEKIFEAFDKLQAGGSTAGGEGINLAYKIAKENFIKGGNNRVIIATDGDFNVGESSDATMERLIEKKREEGVYLTVLGFGMGNYKDSKMEKLSNAGNGNYSYIDNIIEAQKTLGKEFFGTVYTIAKDVKIQIEFNPTKVKAYRLIGYENRMLKAEDFNDDKKDAGDIGSGHTVTALYEIIPAGSKEEVPGVDDLKYQKTDIVTSNDIMTLKLRYKEPDGTASQLITQNVTENDFTKSISNNFKWASAVTEFGLILRDSKFKGKSSFKHIIETAQTAIGEDPDGFRAEFVKLVKTAELLKK